MYNSSIDGEMRLSRAFYARIDVVTRTIVIAGLLLLAAFLPLVALPPVIFVVAAPLLMALATVFVCVTPRSVALPALVDPRAPPSR